MKKVKIAIIEDEIIIADNICTALTELGYEVTEPAISYSEGLELIAAEKPDLVMLDIRLSGKKDGIDLAEKVKQDFNLPFIFLTSFADSATLDRAKKVQPNAYLLKPFNKEELYTSIEIALYNDQENKKKVQSEVIFVKQKHLFVKLRMEEILFFKSDHVYVEIHTFDGERYVVRGSLNDYEEQVNVDFIRVHRSFIINKKYISSFDSKSINLNEIHIPISKNYLESFQKAVMK
jgi:two-component system response regulator LytT